MTIREEYENLKSELMVRLIDATPMCNLEFPFDFKISKEEEHKYFLRGLKTRLATKKTVIMIENTYSRVRLFPSDDIADIFKETFDGILADYKKDVSAAYIEEEWRFRDVTYLEFSEYVDTLVEGLRAAAIPYIEALSKLTPEDIAREIKAKDKLKKSEAYNAPLSTNESGGLFEEK